MSGNAKHQQQNWGKGKNVAKWSIEKNGEQRS